MKSHKEFLNTNAKKQIIKIVMSNFRNKKGIVYAIPFFVESGRVELPSKQATKKLSTRLFPD